MDNQNDTTNVPASVNSKGPKGDNVCDPKPGKVRGTVWKNFSQRTGKHYYKVSLRRIEFDADGTSYLANSFWPEDMKDVASVSPLPHLASRQHGRVRTAA